MEPVAYACIYFAVMSFVAYFMTMYDKQAARFSKKRISEKALLAVAAVGGAIGEYATMRLIHHKTKHKKFMITLPILCVVDIAIIVLIGIFF